MNQTRTPFSHTRCPTVLVVGDIMCDVYLWGNIDRISPEAPVPVFESVRRQQVLGGAANVAANLRALGCEVYLLGAIGRDEAGQCVRDLLRQAGITDTWLLDDDQRPTTEKTRLVAHQQQVLRLDQESQAPLPHELVADAIGRIETLLPQVDGVICSDYRKGVCTPELLQSLFSMAQQAKRPIVVDPKAQDFTLYRGATVLTPNASEVEWASGLRLATPDVLPQAVARLLQQSQSQAMLVTQGKDGMSLFHPPQAPRHIPAQAREVYDVTGAGDTVIAVFSMAFFSGLSLLEAAHTANLAAGIVVGKMGTAVVSREELQFALQHRTPLANHKLLQLDELVAMRQSHRQQGERVVFTNGCFDLLHAGHVQYLQAARALGDRLVVGLNADTSVRQLKGAQRPIVPQAERAQVLAALACVDYVTIFDEPTPLALITALQPDVLVKGGDYNTATIVGHDEVVANGGQVHLVPYVAGLSTTEIIAQIAARYGQKENTWT
jgi:D-beta-D-heptose 7-phosphate kinase/D-beta-D-heptose 1-phosphate adenosyltransferase